MRKVLNKEQQEQRKRICRKDICFHFCRQSGASDEFCKGVFKTLIALHMSENRTRDWNKVHERAMQYVHRCIKETFNERHESARDFRKFVPIPWQLLWMQVTGEIERGE